MDIVQLLQVIVAVLLVTIGLNIIFSVFENIGSSSQTAPAAEQVDKLDGRLERLCDSVREEGSVSLDMPRDYGITVSEEDDTVELVLEGGDYSQEVEGCSSVSIENSEGKIFGARRTWTLEEADNNDEDVTEVNIYGYGGGD